MISNKRYQQKKNPINIILYIVTALVSSLLFLFVAILGVINLKPLYYLNINWLDLPSKLSVPSDLLKEDYSQLIHYMLPFSSSSIDFSAIPLTNSSLSIFSDIQYLLFIIYLITLFLLIAFILLMILLRKSHYKAFLISAITTPLVSITGCSLLILFSKEFSHFLHHFIFGRTFSPDDESLLLTMFPKAYLFQCGGIIIVISLIAAFCLIKRYTNYRKRNNADSLLPKKQNYYYI